MPSYKGRKAAKNLDRRIKDFERSGLMGKPGYRKPGSHKKA
jgi:hypothetical protein